MNKLIGKKHSLLEFFDVVRLQRIQDSITKATGMPSLITDMEGNPITKTSGFCSLCSMVRNTDEGRKRCVHSDSSFGKSMRKITIKKCESAGLLGAGVRIDILGEPRGIWMIGQVLDENYDEEKMILYADEIGVDREKYRKALRKIPKVPYSYLENFSEVLFHAASMLADFATVNFTQKEEIKKRIETEEKLKTSEEHYKQLFESMQGGYALQEMIYDKKGKPVDYKYISVNPAYTKITGIDYKEVEGKLVSEVFSETDDLMIEEFNRIVEMGISSKFSKYSEPLKKYFDIYAFYTKPNHFATITYDVTKQKQMEKEREILDIQLQQQQKLESIGLLAGGVAHEINNPLNGIINYSQLVLDSIEKNPEIEGYLNEIISESERIASIVKYLLQFSRNGKKQHSFARVRDIVDKTISLIRTIFGNEQITIEVDCPDDLPSLRCRSQQIQQVLMNLLINSRDSLNEKYKEYDSNKKIEIVCSAFKKSGEEWLKLDVIDYGIGMTEHVKNKIFEPFFTTKSRDKGTGLGLSVSYGLIREHHGEITVDSALNEKTTFTIRLPFDYEKS